MPLVSKHACPVLQYTDDTHLVHVERQQDVQCLKDALGMFSDVIGLQINFDKSTTVAIHTSPQNTRSLTEI